MCSDSCQSLSISFQSVFEDRVNANFRFRIGIACLFAAVASILYHLMEPLFSESTARVVSSRIVQFAYVFWRLIGGIGFLRRSIPETTALWALFIQALSKLMSPDRVKSAVTLR
jgi:hypothetical protein